MKGIARQGVGSRAGIALRQIAGKFGQADQGKTYNFPVGSWTFVPPKAGYWKFVLWGPGGNSGASGAYLERTIFLTPAQSVAIVVGALGTDTIATLPGGALLSAGAGAGATGGTAAGGDVNLNGTSYGLTSTGANGPPGAGTGGGSGGTGNGTSADGGAGAPANLPFRGGKGMSPGGTAYVTNPGGGQGEATAGSGAGLALVVFVRP
jgi:hypothetical protein